MSARDGSVVVRARRTANLVGRSSLEKFGGRLAPTPWSLAPLRGRCAELQESDDQQADEREDNPRSDVAKVHGFALLWLAEESLRDFAVGAKC